MINLVNRIFGRMGYKLTRRQTVNLKNAAGFGEHLLEKTVLDRGHQEFGLADDELYAIFKASDDTHKWLHYFPFYTSFFTEYRDKPIRMLEIGVDRGGSLKMWKKWFHPEAILVGLDINPDCSQFDNPKESIHVRIGDQTDEQFLTEVAQELGPFDIILDDGGHTTGQMISSFNCLFRGALKENGLYVVEDTHSNYFDSFIDTDITFIEFCKTIVDIMHKHYVITGTPAKFRTDRDDVLNKLEVPYLTAWVNSVSFYDSIVAIRKQHRPLPSSERRY